MSQKIIVFPGSFDPITTGHVDLVKRILPLFDKVYVAVGINLGKSYLFDLDTRMKWLQNEFDQYPNVEVSDFEGLTVNYCKKVGARYLLRGLRNASDFDYEKTISQLNSIIGDNLETLFLISKPEFSHISSTIVREIIKGKGNVKDFVPKGIAADINSIIEKGNV
jgi:pantetheine-phosphate adenylyltransferase